MRSTNDGFKPPTKATSLAAENTTKPNRTPARYDERTGRMKRRGNRARSKEAKKQRSRTQEEDSKKTQTD